MYKLKTLNKIARQHFSMNTDLLFEMGEFIFHPCLMDNPDQSLDSMVSVFRCIECVGGVIPKYSY